METVRRSSREFSTGPGVGPLGGAAWPSSLDGDSGAKDPALGVERGLRALLEGRGIFDLDGDGVAFLEGDGGGLFQNGVDANDNGLRRFRDSGKSRGSDLADGAYKRDAGLFGEGGPDCWLLAAKHRTRAGSSTRCLEEKISKYS